MRLPPSKFYQVLIIHIVKGTRQMDICILISDRCPMSKIQKILLCIVLITGSLIVAGCTSIINQNDIAFLNSLQEFQNESVTRIGHINEDVKLKQWETVRADLGAYQGVISAEVDHLNTLQVSEKVVPVREKAVLALQKQEKILQFCTEPLRTE